MNNEDIEYPRQNCKSIVTFLKLASENELKIYIKTYIEYYGIEKAKDYLDIKNIESYV